MNYFTNLSLSLINITMNKPLPLNATLFNEKIHGNEKVFQLISQLLQTRMKNDLALIKIKIQLIYGHLNQIMI